MESGLTPRLVGFYAGRLYRRMAKALEASARRHCSMWNIQIDELAFGGDGAAKLSGWLAAVEEAPAGTPICLTDVDAFLTGPLDPIWAQPFDLAYTVRDRARSPWPYNSGVIFCRASAGVAAFLYAWMVETRRLVAFPSKGALRSQLRKDFGAAEQAAFHAVLIGPLGQALQTVAVPCLEYNCEDSEWARFDPARTKLVHTKGAFRQLIEGKPIMSRRTREIGGLFKQWQAFDKIAKATPDPVRPPRYTAAWQQGRRWTVAQSARCLDKAFQVLGTPATLLDVGCGWGNVVYRARTQGVDAIGVDVSMAGTDGPVRYADLEAPLDLAQTFDHVLCWEVAEHLTADAADTLCDTLVRHLAPEGTLLFTAAIPGQGGDGHVNEQPLIYWRKKLQARGLRYDRAATVDLVAQWRKAAPDAPWYGDNLQVFKHGVAVDQAVEAALPSIVLTMRTADRTPNENYIGGTLRRLEAQGVDLSTVHVCFTNPTTAWFGPETARLSGVPACHVPTRKLGPNENGLAQVEAGLATGADWIVLLEDDLQFCADFVGSLRRWLRDHDIADRHVYRCFGFTHPPAGKPAAYDCDLPKLRGSQVVMLRRVDAADFLAWGRQHLMTWVKETSWRGNGANPLIAFDKFVAAWALDRWPGVPGVISHPYFVKHIGDQSSIHRKGVRNDGPFAGERWTYAPDVAQEEEEAAV